MAEFFPLEVVRTEKTIRDGVVVTLRPPTTADFSFTQGQYLTLRREFDGVELRRNYSICSAVGDDLQIGIKRVDGGVFSTWANTELSSGASLESMRPQGKFFDPSANPNRSVLFAGGSGITPILSIIRSGLSQDPDSQFTLVYANRSISTIMFREEIEDLKNRYLSRLSVIHVLENDAQDVELLSGRIDREKCLQMFKTLIPPAMFDTAFICGPEPMMLTIRDALADAGMEKENIRFELFSAPQMGRGNVPAQLLKDQAAKITAMITLDGTTQKIDVPPNTSILDAARMAGLDAPFACKAGVCSTCKCKLTEGTVEMAANHALEDYEVSAGFRLSCQSYPITEHVKIDFDL